MSGKGYAGNGGTSTANQELVVRPTGINWTSFSLYKFSFYNDTACNVKINGNPVNLRPQQGFESGKEDAPITSFIILDSGIIFNFVGAY